MTPSTRKVAPRGVRALCTAAVGVAFLALVSAASAAAPLTYITPMAIAAKVRGPVPQIPTDNTSPPSTITATSCKGLPPARQQKFNTFRCSATWSHGRATIWARALPGGTFCASSTGLASCPPGPTVAGDPRLCTNAPAPPTADPNRCALGATEVAITRAMPINFNDPGWTIRNVSCTGSNLSRKCTFSSHTAYGIYYTSTIGFTQADSAWTATIVTTGGGGTSTCIVLPGPPGGRSRWTTGPAPTCTK
jgi:hypothetical protein